jgi:hypothetical protein
MEEKFISLGQDENPKFVKIFQIILGVISIAIALFWIYFNLSAIKNDGTQWISILFLAAFGTYMIRAGLGKNLKFIKISQGSILIKQNTILPPVQIKTRDIKSIEIYPLNIVFNSGQTKKMILRFGISYPEIIEPVKNIIIEIAGKNNIRVEMKDTEN